MTYPHISLCAISALVVMLTNPPSAVTHSLVPCSCRLSYTQNVLRVFSLMLTSLCCASGDIKILKVEILSKAKQNSPSVSLNVCYAYQCLPIPYGEGIMSIFLLFWEVWFVSAGEKWCHTPCFLTEFFILFK